MPRLDRLLTVRIFAFIGILSLLLIFASAFVLFRFQIAERGSDLTEIGTRIADRLQQHAEVSEASDREGEAGVDVSVAASLMSTVLSTPGRTYFVVDAGTGRLLGVTQGGDERADVAGGLDVLETCIESPRIIELNGCSQLTVAIPCNGMLVCCSYEVGRIHQEIDPIVAGFAAVLLAVGLLACVYLHRILRTYALADLEEVDRSVASFVAGDDPQISTVAKSREMQRLKGDVAKLFRAIRLSASRLSAMTDGFGSGVEAYEYYPDLNRLYCSGGLLSLLGVTEGELKDCLLEGLARRKGCLEPSSDAHVVDCELASGKVVRIRHIETNTLCYGMVEDITETVRKEGRLLDAIRKAKDLNERDELTGLANRRKLRNAIEEAIAKAPVPAGVLLVIDLDNFKRVNDEEGHDEGDRLLQEFASVLEGHFRTADVKARIGGDEFAVYLPEAFTVDVLDEKIASLVDATRDRLAEYREKFGLSISVGAAMLGRACCDYETAFRQADAAMYAAKRRGKDGYCIDEDGVASMRKRAKGSRPDVL